MGMRRRSTVPDTGKGTSRAAVLKFLTSLSYSCMLLRDSAAGCLQMGDFQAAQCPLESYLLIVGGYHRRYLLSAP
jgi:hypothetical protein